MADSEFSTIGREILVEEPRLLVEDFLESETQGSDDRNDVSPAPVSPTAPGAPSPAPAATESPVIEITESPSISVTDDESAGLPANPPTAPAPAPAPVPAPMPAPPIAIDRRDGEITGRAVDTTSLPALVVIENATAETTIAALPDLFPDVVDAVLFLATDNANGRFFIAENELRVADNADIDFETSQAHTVQIQALDGNGAVTVSNFSIAVENTIEIEMVDVMRLFNTRNGNHLFTTSESEAAAASQAFPSYRSEDVGFRAVDIADVGEEGSVAVYRIYDTELGAHFYTISGEERDSLLAGGARYVDEGIAFGAFETADPDGDLVNVYRLYNPNSGRHHWTASQEEIDVLNRSGDWQLEGTAFYAFGSGETPPQSSTPVGGAAEPSVGDALDEFMEEAGDLLVV